MSLVVVVGVVVFVGMSLGLGFLEAAISNLVFLSGAVVSCSASGGWTGGSCSTCMAVAADASADALAALRNFPARPTLGMLRIGKKTKLFFSVVVSVIQYSIADCRFQKFTSHCSGVGAVPRATIVYCCLSLW